MKIIYETDKSVEQAVKDLTEAITARKFGVLHVHDLHGTLNKKGVPFERKCQVLEVCNPHKAALVLEDDMDMNMALPCRVSVYEKDGKTHIGMISPRDMLAALSDSPALAKVAEEVERVLDEAMKAAT